MTENIELNAMKTNSNEIINLPSRQPNGTAGFAQGWLRSPAGLKLASVLLVLLTGWLVLRVSEEAMQLQQLIQDTYEAMSLVIPDVRSAANKV